MYGEKMTFAYDLALQSQRPIICDAPSSYPAGIIGKKLAKTRVDLVKFRFEVQKKKLDHRMKWHGPAREIVRENLGVADETHLEDEV